MNALTTAPAQQTITLITGRMGSGKTAALRNSQDGARSLGVPTVELPFEVRCASNQHLRNLVRSAPKGALILFDDGTHQDVNRVVGLASMRPDLHFALAYETAEDLDEWTLYPA